MTQLRGGMSASARTPFTFVTTHRPPVFPTLAIGRLVIRRVLVENVKFKSPEIAELTVTRLRATEVIVSDSLTLPRSNGDRTI
jgi:hypothetical protein